MEFVYMGLLSTVFNWVFSRILQPVFNFVGELLGTVLGWLFDKVLGPLLINVLWPIFEALLDLIFGVLVGILFTIYVGVLEIVEVLQMSFRLFAGLEQVTYKGKSSSLLEMVFHIETVQHAFLLITVIGVILAMMFATLAVSRNFFELDTENTRPVSRILSATMKTMVRFMVIPFTAIFLIQLSGVVLGSFDSVFSKEDTSLAKTVFVISSLNAERGSQTPTDVEVIKGIYDTPWREYYNGSKDYRNKDLVKVDFDLKKIDYVVGFLGAVFLIFVLGMSLLNFVSRIFEVILLYLVSPLFVSTMPMDDGEKFKGWQDMFLAKIFSGYGSVIAMQMYMMLCPKIVGGDVLFGNVTAEASYVMKLVFLLGGGWAVLKCGPMITQLLSFQAASSEREMSGAAVGMMMGAGTWTSSGVSSLAHRISHKSDGRVWQGAKEDGIRPETGQAFGGGARREQGRQMVSHQSNLAGLKRDKTGGYTVRFPGITYRERRDPEGRAIESLKIPFVKLKTGADGKKHVSRVRVAGLEWKGRLSTEKDKDGKVQWKNRMHVSRLRVAGSEWKGRGAIEKDKHGNTQWKNRVHISRLRVVGAEWKGRGVMEKDKDGNAQWKNKVYFSRLSAIGLRREYSPKVNKVETKQLLGFNFEQGEAAGNHPAREQMHRKPEAFRQTDHTKKNEGEGR